MATMSEESRALQDKFMLRLPDGMRERLKRAAAANNRSMNAEILHRLEQSFAPLSNAYENPDKFLMALEELMIRHGYVPGHKDSSNS